MGQLQAQLREVQRDKKKTRAVEESLEKPLGRRGSQVMFDYLIFMCFVSSGESPLAG